MNEKFFTFFYFPGTHGKPRKVRLPYFVVHLILGFAVVGVFTVMGLAGSYTRMLLKTSAFNTLRTEHEALRNRSRSLETVAREARAKLDSLQSLAAEVALTYGLSRSPRPRFPSSVVVMATGYRSDLDGGYSATLKAFNLLKNTRLISSRVPILQSTPLDPLHNDSVTPSIWPVRGRISAGFGQRMDPFTGEGAFHSGIDIAAPAGTTVAAAADGILFVAGPDSGYGTEVLIDHGYGITTKYGHLSRTYAVVGQQVKRGQMVGAVGTTGRSTGPHLHYEVRIYETPVNPAKYLPGMHSGRKSFDGRHPEDAKSPSEVQAWTAPGGRGEPGPSTGGQ